MGVTLLACKSQKLNDNQFHSEMFNWTITIPEGFKSISEKEGQKIHDKGMDVLQESVDAEVVDLSTNIFMFKDNEMHFFESNYQPYEEEDGMSYKEYCKGVNDILYQTFIDQMPGIQIDSTISRETIDHLEFQKFAIHIHYPNNMDLHINLFSRLFGDKEFSVNIVYQDEQKGDLMLNALMHSKFK